MLVLELGCYDQFPPSKSRWKANTFTIFTSNMCAKFTTPIFLKPLEIYQALNSISAGLKPKYEHRFKPVLCCNSHPLKTLQDTAWSSIADLKTRFPVAFLVLLSGQANKQWQVDRMEKQSMEGCPTRDKRCAHLSNATKHACSMFLSACSTSDLCWRVLCLVCYTSYWISWIAKAFERHVLGQGFFT